MEERTVTEERQIEEARERGGAATLRAYLRLSGPGWLQSAITLGGGSLASALYLGVLTGFGLLWLQLIAMLLGVVMLAAISYVTLSTGKRPFRAINDHINPVLGWGWILAVLAANLVWSLPQFALGTAAIQQNLVPSLEGTGGTVLACLFILRLQNAATCTAITQRVPFIVAHLEEGLCFPKLLSHCGPPFLFLPLCQDD